MVVEAPEVAAETPEEGGAEEVAADVALDIAADLFAPEELLAGPDVVDIRPQETKPDVYLGPTAEKFVSLTCLSPGVPGAFSEESGALGLEAGDDYGGGVAVADLDSDGHLDLYVTRFGGTDEIYLTGGRGPVEFQRIVHAVDVQKHTGGQRSAYGVDIDHDGDTDIVTTGGLFEIEQNHGNGKFYFAGGVHFLDAQVPAATGAFGDVNGDGIIDVLIPGGNAGTPPIGSEKGLPDHLFLGAADFSFTETTLPTPKAEGPAMAAALVDLDDDGDLDIYVVNDFGMVTLPNQVYENDGEGHYTDVSAGSGAATEVWGMGLAIGDADGDAVLDLYVTTMFPLGDVLLRGLGGLKYADWSDPSQSSSITNLSGVSWGAVFIDYDSDADQDLYVAHGFHPTLPPADWNPASQPSALLQNTGGVFSDVAEAVGVGGGAISRSPIVADLDEDGMPELIVGNLGRAPYVYRNHCDASAGAIVVRLIPRDGGRTVLGARVRVTTASGVLRRDILSGADGLWGGNPTEAVIGLGAETVAQEVEVRWPNGELWTAKDVPAGTRIELKGQK